MEIRLTLHVPRRRPRPAELVVGWQEPQTAAALRRALAEHLGEPVGGLLAGGRAVADDTPLGEPPLLDGVSLAAVHGAPGDEGASADGAGAQPSALLEVAAVGGPDAGRSLPLVPPGVVVGRTPLAGLRLDDPSLSRAHCRLEVGSDGVHVVDLGSTNGVVVDGRRVEGRAPVDTSSTIGIGASTLRLRRASPPGLPVRHPGDGTALVAPVTAAERELPRPELCAPRAPAEPARTRVPWVAALAPVPVVAVLALFLGPHVLAFAVLGPVVLLTTGVSDRLGSRRRHRRALAEHEQALADHEVRVAAVLAEEARLRHLRHPDAHALLQRATVRGSGLWCSRGERSVRLGLGEVPSSCSVVDGDGNRQVRHIAGAPVVVDLGGSGVLGVVGPPDAVAAVLSAVVGQLVVGCPPSGLRVEHSAPPGSGDWTWLDLLPHRRSDAAPVLVVPDTDAPGVAARITTTLSDGGLVLAGTSAAARLPEGCDRWVEVLGGGRHVLTTPEGRERLIGDAVGPAWRDRLARALAPLREDGAVVSTLPRTLLLAELLGREALTATGLADRWSASRGPTAVVGRRANGHLTLDLATDGPHVLVGGTTGSGKSEFLRTLVTALALDSPPEAVTLLLVDFKGGAAFGPCADLPHVVGMVTDLDDHLVRRVLTSLDAELRRRERLLAGVGAADLADYARRAPSGAEPLPRLVVVVDELRALVDEHPEAVSGLVRVAAQGRSLGIHLVLATQRPAGTVTAEVQANVNLRLAFRVRDRADSVHVVEDDSAARLPADVPGRGVARGGDGVLTTFQVALVAPPPATVSPVEVREAGAGPDTDDERAEGHRTAELAAVVAVVQRAHRDRGGRAPRRPWLPPLPGEVAAGGVPPGTIALADEPDRQLRCAWSWDEQVPLWRVVGQPRSGRTTGLRALVLAAAAAHPPDRLHVQVLGADGGLDDLAALPHVGTVARLDDPVAVDAVLSHLESSRAHAGDPHPLRLLVVDGWERLADGDDARGPTPTAADRLARLVRDAGRSALVCAVAGGRDLLRPRWSGLGGEAVLLGAADPLDVALLGLARGTVGAGAGPGRGVRVRTGREVQVVHATPGTTASVAALPPRGPATLRPWTYRPLPHRVGRADLLGPTTGWLVGVAGSSGVAWGWVPDRDGRRLAVLGPARSGRTTTLRVIARSAVETACPVVLVAPTGKPGRGASGYPVLGPDDADRLVRLRSEHPDLLVLVDDADRLDDTPVRPVLDEIVELADRDAGAVVVATTPATLAGRFRGLDVAVARHRAGVLLRPGPDDAALLGLPRSGLPPGLTTAPPGRGLLVLDGQATPVQVLLDEADAAPARAS